MENVLYPIHSDDKGAEVKNLHQAILSLRKKLALKSLDSLYGESSFRNTLDKEIKEELFGEATVQIITSFQEHEMNSSANGQVDELTSTAINSLLVKYKLLPAKPVPYSVSGTVYDKWVEPMPEAFVKVFENNMRSERLLAEAKTNANGQYSIHYPADKLTNKNIEGPDLVIRIHGHQGDILYTSGIYYNTSPQSKVDINLGPQPYNGPSEFTSAIAKIKPFTGQVPVDKLTENNKEHDLTYLINKTDIQTNILLQLVASFRFEKKNAIPAVIYYGIMSQLKSFRNADGKGTILPKDLEGTMEKVYSDLWSSPASTLMMAYQKAAASNIIPYKLWEEKDKIQSELQKLKTNPPPPGDGAVLPTIYKKITIADLNASQQQAVIENLPKGNVGDNFWKTLSKDPSFKDDAGSAAVQKLKAVFTLSDWTGDNTALTGYIVDQNKIKSVSDFNSLVSKNTSDWAGIIQGSGAIPGSANSQSTIQTIASNIAAGIERLYPTPVFADRFVKSTTLPIVNRDYISGILKAADFDITKTTVPQYLNAFVQKNTLPPESDQQTITYQLMGMQRVYRTVRNAETAVALLSANIQSARQIYAMGNSNFVNRFKDSLGGKENAANIYDQAAAAHAGATYLTGQLASNLNNPPAKVMPTYGDVKQTVFGTNYPGLVNLFGLAASYCECKDCESFLGIPAYLTDLLDFAYQRKTTGASSKSNSRAVLLANNYLSNKQQWRRRPDLGDIDLNCDNTNIELPYLDIVNELLEDYIIPPIAAFKINLKGKRSERWLINTFCCGSAIF